MQTALRNCSGLFLLQSGIERDYPPVLDGARDDSHWASEDVRICRGESGVGASNVDRNFGWAQVRSAALRETADALEAGAGMQADAVSCAVRKSASLSSQATARPAASATDFSNPIFLSLGILTTLEWF